MDRRTFMKLLGGLASMPIVGRFAKPLQSETVREGIASVSEGGMKLYEMVVADKVVKEEKYIEKNWLALVELTGGTDLQEANILTDLTLLLM